jgi:hypothetical protein
VDDLRARVAVRKRLRARRRLMAAGVAVAAMAVVVVPLLDRPDDRPTRVVAGPEPAPGATTTVPVGFVPGVPVSSRLEYSVPPGWETVFADSHRLVVATRPLSDRDRELALLGRTDAAFTGLPNDAVVVAVGLDSLEARSGTDWDGTSLDPKPYAVAEQQALPGGIKVRRGVVESGVRVTTYAGGAAPSTRLQEADDLAGGIRRVTTGDPSVRPPPPPPGSTVGLPGGPLPVPEQGLPEVARTGAGSTGLVLVAGQDCAYLRRADAQLDLPAHRPEAGACGARPPGTGIAALGQPVLLMGGPGTEWRSAVILRAGPAVRSVSARTADGRSVAATLGEDGWGMAVSTGRLFLLTAFDAAGRPVAEAFVK